MADSTRQQAADAAGTAKDKAQQATNKVKDTAQQALNTASPALDKAQDTAISVANSAQERTSNTIESRKGQAADSLSGVASAFSMIGQQLRENDQGTVAGLTDQAATRINAAADYLRNRDLRGIAGDVESLARRQPTLFLASAFTLGIFASRFLKSSGGGFDLSQVTNGLNLGSLLPSSNNQDSPQRDMQNGPRADSFVQTQGQPGQEHPSYSPAPYAPSARQPAAPLGQQANGQAYYDPGSTGEHFREVPLS